MHKMYVIGVCEHAGALLFHPTRRINTSYHNWLRRGAGWLSLLFISPYKHNYGGGGMKSHKSVLC